MIYTYLGGQATWCWGSKFFTGRQRVDLSATQAHSGAEFDDLRKQPWSSKHTDSGSDVLEDLCVESGFLPQSHQAGG